MIVMALNGCGLSSSLALVSQCLVVPQHASVAYIPGYALHAVAANKRLTMVIMLIPIQAHHPQLHMDHTRKRTNNYHLFASYFCIMHYPLIHPLHHPIHSFHSLLSSPIPYTFIYPMSNICTIYLHASLINESMHASPY